METLNKIILTALIFGLPWLFACEEREEPAPISGSPELFLKGKLDGNVFEYYAGDNGVVAKASTYILYDQKWFSAVISNQGDFDFEIAIKNMDAGVVDVAGSLAPGALTELKDSVISVYRVVFTPLEAESGATYEWNFGDGNTSNESQPVHDYELVESEYNVCLTINRTNGCSSTICQSIKPHFLGKLDIQTQNSSNGLWLLNPVVADFEAVNYEWILNGTTIANTRDVALQTGVGDSIWNICLIAKSRQSQTFEKCIQINPAENPGLCTSNFDFVVNSMQDTIIVSEEARVYALEMALANGSLRVAQFDDNSFEIIDSQPYDDDPYGNPTRKIEFKAQLRLVDENGQFHLLEIDEAVLAVGLGN